MRQQRPLIFAPLSAAILVAMLIAASAAHPVAAQISVANAPAAAARSASTAAAGPAPAANTAAGSSASAAAPETWQPSPAALAQMDAPVAVGAYSLRLPERWRAAALPAGLHPPAGVTFFGFVGLEHPDNSKPSITIVMLTLPPGTPPKSLDEVLISMAGGKKRLWTSFAMTSPEKGRIGALTFERCETKGTVSGAYGIRTAQAILYAAIDKDGTIIEMGAEDAAPYSAQTLALAEAALQTFARR